MFSSLILVESFCPKDVPIGLVINSLPSLKADVPHGLVISYFVLDPVVRSPPRLLNTFTSFVTGSVVK